MKKIIFAGSLLFGLAFLLTININVLSSSNKDIDISATEETEAVSGFEMETASCGSSGGTYQRCVPPSGTCSVTAQTVC